MDPTAPNNNQPNPGSTTPPNPIQPGQFVVAGDDQAPAPIAPQATQEPAPTPPQPAVSLAGERPESVAPQVMPTTPTANGASQPDPTPFTVPGVGQQSTPETKSGGGSKTKSIIIVLAVLILIAIIGAVVYFFVLPQLKKNSAKTQTSTDVQIEEPSPLPPNTGTGFGDIPDSTTSAEPAAPANTGALATPTPPITNSSPTSP